MSVDGPTTDIPNSDENCGIEPAIAQQIIDARTAAGVPFAQVDDVFAYTDIPVGLWDRIRDRGIIL